jgi:hypothetical protein
VRQTPTDRVSEVTDHFFGNNLNLYHKQNEDKTAQSSKGLKWADISNTEMKIFLATIILRGQKKEETILRITDPFLEIPIFGKFMSQNRFIQIWFSLHFTNN